jgi:hypothetical protein
MSPAIAVTIPARRQKLTFARSGRSHMILKRGKDHSATSFA